MKVKLLSILTLIFLIFACKHSNNGKQENKENEIEKGSEIVDENLPNIVFKIASKDELKKDEMPFILQVLGDGKGQSISIDWGDGDKKDYTFQSDETSTISYTIEADAEIKLYGKLKLFDATMQGSIKSIRFYNSRKLETLRLSSNKIEKIDLLPLSSLKELQITNNQLTSIDVSCLPHLSELYCGWNDISVLDVSKNPNLMVLTCYNTQITNLNLANNLLLEVLTAGDNKYNTIPILTSNINLKSIDFEHCNFAQLDLKALKKLEKARLSGNKLTSIDLSQNNGLIYLDISKNNLEDIDLDNLTKIETLMLDNNKLKSLNLKNNKRLNIIKLQTNCFSACALNKIFKDVCVPLTETNGFGISENEGASTSKTSIAKDKGWRLDMEGDGSASCE